MYTNIQFIKPTLPALKYEHNKYTVSYMFRHFLSAVMKYAWLFTRQKRKKLLWVWNARLTRGKCGS